MYGPAAGSRNPQAANLLRHILSAISLRPRKRERTKPRKTACSLAIYPLFRHFVLSRFRGEKSFDQVLWTGGRVNSSGCRKAVACAAGIVRVSGGRRFSARFS
jgi:hypothetical protein